MSGQRGDVRGVPNGADGNDGDKTVELTHSTIAKLNELRANKQHPRLLVLAGPAMGQLFELAEGSTILGRSPDADVVLVDDGISRKHARIDRTPDGHRVYDLGSTNGIFVNGERVRESALEPGDKLRIGQTTVLKFSLHDDLEESFQKNMYASAVRDGLTGIYNKRYFRDALSTEFAHCSRHGLQLSVMMIDIDHFKKVNDTYGHLAGDYVLKEVASLVADGLRKEDVLCRYGGEELAVLLRTTGRDEAFTVAERIRGSVAGHLFEHEGGSIGVTISIGIATLIEHNLPSAIHLVRAADEQLYAAKMAGRNRTVCV